MEHRERQRDEDEREIGENPEDIIIPGEDDDAIDPDDDDTLGRPVQLEP
jgi:hypothetical protein